MTFFGEAPEADGGARNSHDAREVPGKKRCVGRWSEFPPQFFHHPVINGVIAYTMYKMYKAYDNMFD